MTMPNELRTDYKSDQLMPSQNGKRTFNIVDSDGNIVLENVHIEDKSNYLQVGDEYGSEIINEQNTIINALMKGAYVRYETYAEYETAYENGEVAEGSLVIIDELTNDNITALQVAYNNSNVKAALDVHGNNISQINSDLSEKADKSDLANLITFRTINGNKNVVVGQNSFSLTAPSVSGYTPVLAIFNSSWANQLIPYERLSTIDFSTRTFEFKVEGAEAASNIPFAYTVMYIKNFS